MRKQVELIEKAGRTYHRLTQEELFSGDVASSAAKEELSWCSAAALLKVPGKTNIQSKEYLFTPATIIPGLNICFVWLKQLLQQYELLLELIFFTP